MNGSLALVGSGEYLPQMAEFEKSLIDDGVKNGKKPIYIQIPTAAGRESETRLNHWRDLGKEQAERLSPLRKLNFTEWDTAQPIELGGINHLDYMLLFKKYIIKQEPSYKLNDIGEKYVKMNKIEYEGSLDKLFQTDINKFIQYNLRDVEIIIELEKKLKFIDLTVAICHLFQKD